MPRLGLFSQIYVRAIALVVLALATMLVLSHMHEYRTVVRAWQADMTQEAAWLARHWQGNVDPELFAQAWSSTHDGVRMQIIDGAGVVVADSDLVGQSALAPGVYRATRVQGRAPILLDTGMGELVLSRRAIPFFPAQSQFELLLVTLGLALIAGILLFPLIRGLTNSFDELSNLARRVADGRFGETIPEEGAPDIVAVIASFNEMSRRLKQAEIKNHCLLRDVSHELRSPLARFAALVDTANRHPEELTELSHRLKDEIQLMNRLVADVLLTARLDAPEPELDLVPTNIDEWLGATAARLGGSIEAAGAKWAVKIGSGEATVVLDPQRMMQVLGNMTENAIRAVEGCDAPQIELRLTLGTDAVISVTDNGAGIAEADLPHVFDRFYRVDQGRAQADGGAGLGLAICKAIVTAHGGRIEIQSTPGTGTQILITLPIAASPV